MNVPKVVNFLVKGIKDPDSWSFREDYNEAFKNEALRLYKEHISIFFKLLEHKGYPIENNERFYLNILKDKAIRKNYNDLKDEFYLLFQLNISETTTEQIIHKFIQIVDNEISQFKYLAFLDTFLVNKGFKKNHSNLDTLYNQVEVEYKKYELLKFEKELLGVEEFNNDKNINLQDIGLMS
ncbi:hypothetical protein [Cytobacillus firmus]|uniref:hypothetical protein n=1 Tax=Cytobacillus firmus TaxID=1399 RepID=UPI0021C8F8C6|nr:hypothetical protein [Cytobacillus firmus]